MKFKPKFKEGDNFIVSSCYLGLDAKYIGKVGKITGIENTSRKTYNAIMSNGIKIYFYQREIKKISKKRYFFEAL